jgi:hypothetical protein
VTDQELNQRLKQLVNDAIADSPEIQRVVADWEDQGIKIVDLMLTATIERRASKPQATGDSIGWLDDLYQGRPIVSADWLQRLHNIPDNR